MLLPLKAVITSKPRKDGKYVIYFQYCFSSTNRVLLSSDIAVPKAFWNAKRQCISKSLPPDAGDADALNRELDRVRKIIEAIIEHGTSIGEANVAAYVKGLYAPDFKIETLQKSPVVIPLKKREPDFFAELDLFIKSKEKKVDTRGLANFKSLKGRLLAYEQHRGKKITFSSLDYNFYSELVEFLTYDYELKRKKVPEYGLKTSSIGQTIKKLRSFIKDRTRRKAITAIDMEDFKILDEECDAIYLTYDEIGAIYDLDLSHDPVMSLYRDVFVLGCLTGLRFSDYSSLRSTDVRGKLLYKKTDKKDKWVIIPLRQEAADIFKSRFGGTPPVISNPVFNRYIKEIAEMAGINQPITFSYKKGTKDVTTTKPKSQWVTSHTCRRSFCTNEYLAGTDIHLIMKISGHKTHKNFFKYIRATEEEAAQRIQDVWASRNNMQAFGLRKAV